jgi:hypothetical protein
MWCCRRTEISCTDRVGNEKVLHSSVFRFVFLYGARGEFTDDVSEIAVDPIFTGHRILTRDQ